jgi:MarR family 2-MHQ and catechol resistance regulon transcriptional repressor
MESPRPTPGDTDLALKLWVVLARAHAAVARHSTADLVRHGLSPGEFGILEALYHKGPMLLGEVQRKILASSGGVTYLVDRLEKQGLVRRRESPDDRRARFAALTPAGEAFIARIFPAHADAIVHATAGLSEREKRTAIRLIRKLGLAAAAAEPAAARETKPHRASRRRPARRRPAPEGGAR